MTNLFLFLTSFMAAFVKDPLLLRMELWVEMLENVAFMIPIWILVMMFLKLWGVILIGAATSEDCLVLGLYLLVDT